MIRWKYVAPRLAALSIVMLVALLSVDVILKFSIIQAGQLAVGARVEIGTVDTSLRRADLEIHHLAVAHPEAPMKNLVQADRAVLNLDVGAALRSAGHVPAGESAGGMGPITRFAWIERKAT